jgi:hypothetical protein
MKKNLILIATVLALSLPWVGCNKSGKLAQPSTFTPPSGPVELKVKWPQGEHIVQDMDMKMNMELSVPGQPAPMKQDMTMGEKYGLTVLKETPDSGHEVEMEFLSARMSVAMGGKTMLDYDSDKKPGGDKANPVAGEVAAAFQKIIGAKINYFLDASNEVERIEGVDALLNRLGTGDQAGAATSIKSMFSEGYFKQVMSANRFIPPKPVQPGDTWPIKMDIAMGDLGTMMMDYDFTFQSWEMHGKRNCARIEFQGTINSTPGTNANPAGMSTSILEGNSSGVSWFDPELGITIDTTMNQDIKMVMNMPMNPRGNPGAAGRMQTITNQMNQVINIKLVSVK